MVNSFSSFWEWLEACFSWFFSPTLLSDPFISLIIKGLEFLFGCWLLYLLIMKPILMLIKCIDNKIFK